MKDNGKNDRRSVPNIVALKLCLGALILFFVIAGKGNNSPAPVSPAPPVSPPQAKTVNLKLDSFCCDKTTESGADEVFIMVIGKRTDGASYGQRFPHATGHWDVNDGNQPNDNPSGDSHCITNKPLFSGELLPGQAWDVIVSLMEEDGGNTKSAQQAAAALAASSGDPYAVAGGALIGLLTAAGVSINDTDDFLGSFVIHIANNNGNITHQWKGIDRIGHINRDLHGGVGHEYRFNGDGSDYVAWFRVNY